MIKPLDLYYADKRSQAAQYVYHKLKSGVCKVIKVPRAGATTSLVIESYMRKELSVVLTTTNNIIKKTVIEGINRVSNENKLKPPNIIHLASNFECVHYQNVRSEFESNIIRLEKEIKELKQGVANGSATKEELKNKLLEYGKERGTYNRLRKLKVVPKSEDCGQECIYFSECPCMKVLTEKSGDIYVLTYDKLINIMRVIRHGKRKHSNNEAILNILKQCKNIILDEAHIIDREPFSVEVNMANRIIKGDFLQLYRDEQYENLSKLIQLIYKLFIDNDIREAIRNSQKTAKADDYYKYHNKNVVRRPIKQEINPKTKRLKDLTIFSAVLQEIFELVISGDAYKYKISSDELNTLLDYANLLNEKDYVITTDRINNELITKVATLGNSLHTYLGEFLRETQNHKDYRIMITTATFGDFNYKKLLKRNTKIVEIPFGKGGDPLKSVERMRIFSMDFNLSSNSHWYNSINQQLDKLLEILTYGIDEFGSENCFYCTISEANAQLIEKALKERGYNQKIYYYRGSETIGVECEARFGVLIGAAFIPQNSKYYAEDNKAKRREALFDMWNATIQAMNRIKDPQGKINSAILTIMGEKDLSDILKHASQGGLSVPKVIPCYSNSRINYAIIQKHMKTLSEDRNDEKLKNLAGKISVNSDSDKQQSNSEKIVLSSKSSFGNYKVGLKALYILYEKNYPIIDFFDRLDEGESREDFSEKRQKCQPSQVLICSEITNVECEDVDFNTIGLKSFSDSDWQRHKAGKESIVTELISKQDTVKVLGFTGLQLNGVKHITEALEKKGIRPLIVKDSLTYSLHIITEPIKAKIAKRICKDVLDKIHDSGIKFKCDIFPRHTSQKNAKGNGSNDYRLPMYHGEQAYSYQEKVFTTDIENMLVPVNDLTRFEEIHDKQDAEYVSAYYPKEEPENLDKDNSN